MAASINADNGAVSGSAGLKSTADSTGVLALQTNGTTAVSISTAQVVSLTSGLAVTGALSATGTGTLRDLITTTGALIQGTSIFRVESTAAALPAGTLAGLGLEMYASSGTQKLSVYNRTTNLAGPLDLLGSTFNFNAILDISNASAGQIKFPATQNASSDANTLDDYEEGTWTPNLTGDGGGSGQTYTAQTGTYTKVGRVVTVGFYINLSAKGTITGNVIISNLPFTVLNTGALIAGGALALWLNLAVNHNVIGMYCNTNSTNIYLWGSTGTASTPPTLTTTDIANNTRFWGSATYMTA